MKKHLGWMLGICVFFCMPLISFAEMMHIFISPVEGIHTLLAPFGENRGGYAHEGVDIEVSMWTPLYAVEAGIVTKAAPDSKGIENGGGQMIFINHGQGVESRYMHLGAYAVSVGDRVEKGDLIGFSGDSGDATKPLLHYELRIDQIPVDPIFMFKTAEDIIQEPMQTLMPAMPIEAESFLIAQT
ncbi:MAG: M23 family metallopeptidase [Niameybacter sp.]|uniref:M23 family metallopeptidase n=1 Tax=Niameybacter sp. TaxID=2033640 RepID=UPI002FC6B5CB